MVVSSWQRVIVHQVRKSDISLEHDELPLGMEHRHQNPACVHSWFACLVQPFVLFLTSFSSSSYPLSVQRSDDLYLNGLQRDRFLPFIDLLKRKCDVLSMWDSEIDYRLIQKVQSGTVPVFFIGKESRQDFDDLFYELVGKNRSVQPTALTTQGRKVKIPLASLSVGVARFSFEDLCQKALGAADYLVIGQHFHTVFVEKIPVLSLNELNWVRRFITFVDSMYESNVKLILQSNVPIREIFQPETKTEHDEVFAFDRTLSRLDEMASESYLRKRWSAKALESKAELLSKQKAKFSMEAS